MENKLTLPFVNEGKPFTVGNWTVEMHEETLALLKEENPLLSPEEQDALFRYYVIFIGLKSIDSSVKLEDVKALHVENIMDLFKIIYYKGKIDIFFHETNKKKESE